VSVIKSGGVLLLLAVPVALYVAWQVNGVVRSDLVAEPPADRGPPKEQLEAAAKKTAAWADRVKDTVAFAERYGTAAPADAAAEPDTKTVAKAAAARSAELTDLDQFLSGLDRPTFAGALKAQYTTWREGDKGIKEATAKVTAWLGKPLAVAARADADEATKEALALIAAYANCSKFSDKAQAAAWRVQVRVRVAGALKKLAEEQYAAAVREKLPLKPGGNAATAAADTHRALRELIGALDDDLKQADEVKARLDARTRAEAESMGAVADACAAQEKLLGVFAREDLFDNPAGAGAWLKEVDRLYGRTKDDAVRKLIRDKVQQFCDAFIPAEARLDDVVLIKGERVARKDVVVKWDATIDGKVVTKVQPLGASADGINEFTLAVNPPGPNAFVVYNGREDLPRDLKPTRLSEAAKVFGDERRKLADSITVPKWSAKSADELKNKCVAQKDLVDQLQVPGGGSPKNGPKIWTRLSGLAAGMAGCPDLFEADK
jgi:hypothetical protein